LRDDAPMLALFSVPRNLGYFALAGLVGIESSGVPVPGETALITSSVLASQGHLSIELVIIIAAAAAIVGDNIGYLIGARVGRKLLTRPGRFEKQRKTALVRGEKLMTEHGAKTVFFGRFIAGLRIWASWLAGMTTMRWPTFLLWNALGGICWATTFGLVGYYGGTAAAHLITRIGLGLAAMVIVIGIGVYILIQRRIEKAFEGNDEEAAAADDPA
jgi:membrane protein DedA with SNARE-associated domain